jgi:predicted house-cleaning noncanonical NTP pyrophosphatase (MazG superfamily)
MDDERVPGALSRVLADIADEREAQDRLWGVQEFPDGSGPAYVQRADEAKAECAAAHERGELTWRHILTEEFFEVLAESDLGRLRVELIQTAAVAVKWVQSIDGRDDALPHRSEKPDGASDPTTDTEQPNPTTDPEQPGPTEPTDLSESACLAEPEGHTEPPGLAKLARLSEPACLTEPASPAEPTAQSASPAQPTGPAEPPGRAEPSGLAEPAGTAEPAGLGGLAGFTERALAKPVGLAEAGAPNEPAGFTEAAGLASRAGLAEPAGLTEPTGLGESAGLAKQAGLGEATGLGEPGAPGRSLGRAEKLVRDRIPEIIRESGRNPVTRVAERSEYAALLSDKLYEEAGEYVASGDPSELADVLEVIRTLASLHGLTPTALERLRAEKATERGGFAHRHVLSLEPTNG